MSLMSKEEGEKTRGIFRDTYNLYLKYHAAEGRGFWDAFMADFNNLYEKYNKDELCGRILIAVLGQLEEEHR